MAVIRDFWLMTNLGLIFSLVFLFTQYLFPQDSTYQQIDLSGKYALQFQISENFKLTSFQGSIISGKYNFSNSLALRIGVSLEFYDNVADQNITEPSSKTQSDRELDKSTFSIQFKPQLIYSFPILKEVSFYCGGGPFLTISNQKENEHTTYDTLISKYEGTTTGYGYGLELVGGVECFVRNNISLSAEYGIQISHSKYESEFKNKNGSLESTGRQNSAYTRIGGNSVRMGLSIYF